MLLLKLLIALIVLHLAMGFVQLSISYYAGDIADHGARGFVSHTPIGALVGGSVTDSEDMEERQTGGGLNLTDPRSAFEIVNRLSNTIGGLTILQYGFLEEIKPDDGFVYNIVVAFHLLGLLFWLALGVSLLYILFDSNILTSRLGLGLIAGGFGLTALAGLRSFVGSLGG